MLRLNNLQIYRDDAYFLTILCEVETVVDTHHLHPQLVERQIFKQHAFCDKDSDVEEATIRAFKRLVKDLRTTGKLTRIVG